MSKTDSALNIICLETKAFYALVDEVIRHVRQATPKHQERWIDDKDAMALLGVKSKTTLQKYRDEGLIRFSQPTRKTILYDRNSIMEFIEDNAKNPF